MLMLSRKVDECKPLVGGEFTVTVVAGKRAALQVQAVVAEAGGEPPTVAYSVSLGDVDTTTFRRYASSDRVVPLDTFRIRPVDAGANGLSGAMPAFNVSSTSTVYGPVKEGVTVVYRQGLTLVHFSAQPEPFLTLQYNLNTLNTPYTPPIHPLNIPCAHPLPHETHLCRAEK
jgi:hypothetical protein